MAAATDFERDPVYASLLRGSEVKAIVLAAERDRLLERVLRRQAVESCDDPYSSRSWVERYRAVNIADLYRAWLSELESRSVPVILLDARDREFRVLDSADSLLALVDGRGPRWTRQRIQEWNEQNRFQYQQVLLPYGVRTPGSDRTATRDLVFRSPVAGKSVLDVGSSEGYFCFAAEMRDAERVKGIELRAPRFEMACQLKEIRGSRVEFERRDVGKRPIREDWDVILLLNVVHHLSEPFGVLRNLAERARERLTVEFPTFADARFRKHRRIWFPWFYNRLPLVGVSSLQKGIDQTFVYSPRAVRAFFLELDTEIRAVELEPSPMPGRWLAHALK